MSQISFSTIWSEITTAQEAKETRDAAYKHLLSLGYTARRFVLKGQVRKWAGLGIPDGRMCDVYMIDTSAPQEVAKNVEKEFIDRVLYGYADQKYYANIMSR